METNKSNIRKLMREKFEAVASDVLHQRSNTACGFLIRTPEFENARVIMLYLSTPLETDTASLALKAWQEGKTVVVPKVAWHQRRMLPTEITSLHQSGLTTIGPGVREPIAGKPVPVEFIDLVVVPGVAFSPQGYRIGRGMGFYDRFLAQPDFTGLSCGLAFEDQVIDNLPVLDHDMPLGMLVTERGIRRFSPNLIRG
jgi:5-formyltetrahydrofolate cyclo-ligase